MSAPHHQDRAQVAGARSAAAAPPRGQGARPRPQALRGRSSAHPVRDIVDRLDAATGDQPLTVRDIVSAFGATAFIPVLLIPALLVVSPLSGIPFFSSLCGLSIALIAGQMLLRRRQLWLPGVLMRRRIEAAHLHRATGWLGRVADWVDGHARDRLRVLTDPPANAVAQALCVVCGLSMPFLELVPFSSSLLGAAVSLMAAGFLTRDGLYVLGGFTLVALAVSVPVAVSIGLAG